MDLVFKSLTPWTKNTRNAVKAVAQDMDARDREEIFSIRSADSDAEDLVRDIATTILMHGMIEGFVAFEDTGRLLEPVAVATAMRTGLPGVASVALFGRDGRRRAMPAVWAEMGRRQAILRDRHGIHMGQVPMLADHKAARRMARRVGGEEVFSYGPIGRDGQEFIHVIWRFDHGVSETGSAKNTKAA